MKTLIAYYSFEGHAEKVAKALAAELGADTLKIELADEKKRAGLIKYVWGGKMVFSKKEPELKPISQDINGYDLLVLGGPIWASTPAPPLTSFLRKFKITGKNVAFFLCHLGGPGNAAEKMAKELEGNTLKGGFTIRQEGESLHNLNEEISSWAAKLRS